MAEFVKPEFVKPFCPCDVGRPQDCKPEEWGDAHGIWTPCKLCRWLVPHYEHVDG